MNRDKRRLIISLLCVLAFSGGCANMRPATPATAKGYTELCQSYVGQDVSDLFANWGGSDRTFTEADGTKVYGYVKAKRSGMYYELEPAGLMRYPPHLESPVVSGDVIFDDSGFGWCMTYFVADRENKIVKVIWTGRCRARETE
jgi:hypothetical protein